MTDGHLSRRAREDVSDSTRSSWQPSTVELPRDVALHLLTQTGHLLSCSKCARARQAIMCCESSPSGLYCDRAYGHGYIGGHQAQTEDGKTVVWPFG